MPRSAPRTLTRALLRALVVPCVFTGALAASVGLSHAAGLVDTVEVVQAREEAASRQVAADRVAVLVESHDCWTGPSPHGDDVIPGHAVVALPGGAPRLLSSRVGFAIWLDGRPGTLHAFCR